jgi:hypothetical protein
MTADMPMAPFVPVKTNVKKTGLPPIGPVLGPVFPNRFGGMPQLLHGYTFIPQISLAYCLIVRSVENLPIRATFKMAILVHVSGSRNVSLTRF